MKYRYEWLECEKEYFERDRKRWIEKVLGNARIVAPDATYAERFGVTGDEKLHETEKRISDTRTAAERAAF